MLRSTKEIRGYELQAKDGAIGKVHGLLFDDRNWTVRYLVANTGSWLIDRLVLLVPDELGDPDWSEKVLPVRLTRKQVEESPPIEADKPVSRQRQEALHVYYGWPMYWAVPPEHVLAVSPAVETGPSVTSNDDDGDPNLRSTRQVGDYRTEARDGPVGRVHDFIVDDDGWAIRYVVVDTGDWLPGRRMLVASSWIQGIDWADAVVRVDLAKREIEESPEYDASASVNRQYEERLYDFLGRPKYW